MDVSIVISTFHRDESLKKTLESLASIDSDGLHWEVLLIDNAGQRSTQELINRFKDKVSISYYIEKTQGKNYALNHGIPFALADLLVFTDDDVIVDQNWLKELWAGVVRWPEHNVFGGKILPHWPNGKRLPPDIDKNFYYSAYAISNEHYQEGPIPATKVWGPNMAIRRKLFESGRQFNTDIGPSGKNYIMGSETELTSRLEKMGHESIHLPKAFVYHQIRENQLKPKWMFDRAFRLGRSDSYYELQAEAVKVNGVPRYLYRLLFASGLKRLWATLTFNKIQQLNSGIHYWKIKGHIYQHHQGIYKNSVQKQSNGSVK